MNIVLFEDPAIREQLKPLTLTRPVGMLRLGIQTLKEKWESRLNAQVSFLTEGYLSSKYKLVLADSNLFINAAFLPTPALVEALGNLKNNELLTCDGLAVAYLAAKPHDTDQLLATYQIKVLLSEACRSIKRLPDLFLQNGNEIRADYELLTAGRISAAISDPFTKVYAPHQVFVEAGAQIKAAVINAEEGPVYIGKNAVIQEGALIIGPASIGEEAKVAYGAKIRQNTSLGPVCRVGGEIGNSIFHAFTNKAHDGFLGNSYIGEWCNLGANTNASNLKNDYKEVKLYSYLSRKSELSGEIFCGTFMGDYSKAGISTMFNTGTVVGVSSNIFGGGFQAKFIESFSWGGAAEGYENYRFEKAIEVINATMSRRGLSLSDLEVEILQSIYKQASHAV